MTRDTLPSLTMFPGLPSPEVRARSVWPVTSLHNGLSGLISTAWSVDSTPVKRSMEEGTPFIGIIWKREEEGMTRAFSKILAAPNNNQNNLTSLSSALFRKRRLFKARDDKS